MTAEKKLLALIDTMHGAARKGPFVDAQGKLDITRIEAAKVGASTGERFALEFVLHVWDRYEYSFDAIAALQRWDESHREAFADWARDPFWL